MSDAKLVAAIQRQLADAEVERLRLVGELEDMRLRAVRAESMLASVSGVTRLELVAAERAKRDGLLAALKDARVPAAAEANRQRLDWRGDDAVERLARIDAAIAAAEAES
jgi:hypothetical protein